MDHQKILVVDDDADVAYMTATMLNILGHSAEHAHSGKEAIAYCIATPPALILLDLDMPDLDGFDTLVLLRSFPSLVDVPVVAYSGQGDPGTRARTRAAGFAGHLLKPVPMDAMLGMLELTVGQSSSCQC